MTPPGGRRVCRGCGAQKGYTQASGNVYGKGHTITLGIVVLLTMLIPAVLSFLRLRKGETSFRSANIHTG